jgi:histidine triad (HIT) family protein
MDCIFCRIVAREIPAGIVYQDEYVTAFRDINPEAPVHILVIPNAHLGALHVLQASEESVLGKLCLAAGAIAQQEGISGEGYRLVANFGPDAGQVVPHLHMHLLGGRSFSWPPG